MATQGYSRPPYSPTRFPAGITNANKGEVLSNMGQLDPTKFITFFEDFTGIAPAGLGQFTQVDGEGGLAEVEIDDTTPGSVSSAACFVLSADRRFFLKARLAVDDVSGEFVLGLTDSATTPTEGVTLTFSDNTITLATLGVQADTDTYTSSVENAEFVELGIEYSPNKSLTAFLNGNPIARLRPTAFSASAVRAAIATDSDEVVTLDYLFAAVER